MKDFPIAFFLITLPVMVCIMFVIYKAKSYYHKQKHDSLLKKIGNDYVYKKESVCCHTFKSGVAKSHQLFNRCNLYVLDNGILIMGYVKFLGQTFYSSTVLLTKEPQRYSSMNGDTLVINPNKVNPDSFGNTVYLDYGNSSWTEGNVTINLKGLNDEEKQFFRVI